LHLGATPFGIYATSAPQQVEYVIRDSGARLWISEKMFEPTLASVAPRCPALEHVLRLTPGAPELDGPEPDGFDFDRSWRAVTPEDLYAAEIAALYTDVHG
jgi:long-chain acyl-CoA synthetase